MTTTYRDTVREQAIFISNFSESLVGKTRPGFKITTEDFLSNSKLKKYIEDNKNSKNIKKFSFNFIELVIEFINDVFKRKKAEVDDSIIKNLNLLKNQYK